MIVAHRFLLPAASKRGDMNPISRTFHAPLGSPFASLFAFATSFESGARNLYTAPQTSVTSTGLVPPEVRHPPRSVLPDGSESDAPKLS